MAACPSVLLALTLLTLCGCPAPRATTVPPPQPWHTRSLFPAATLSGANGPGSSFAGPAPSGRSGIFSVKPHAAGDDRDGARPMRLRGGRSTALGQRLQNLHYVMKKDPQSYLPEVQGHVDNWNAASWRCSPRLTSRLTE